MTGELIPHVTSFAQDASERVRAADAAFAKSLQSLAASRANFAITQLRISQSEVLISAADRLILVLGREIISRPDSFEVA